MSTRHRRSSIGSKQPHYVWLLVSLSVTIVKLLRSTGVHAWVLTTTQPHISHNTYTTNKLVCYSTSSSDTNKQDNKELVLGGVSDFEKWFSNTPKSQCDPSVQHAAFGSLRGLTCSDKATSLPAVFLKVPKSVVLRSPFDEQWDSNLALQLWEELQKGSRSDIYGYCSLLTRGETVSSSSSYVPPSTAPDAVRHWSDSEKGLLEPSAAGTKLLKLHDTQQAQWKQKFQDSRSSITMEQFEWCMEVVHSRSFRGNFGADQLLSSLAPAIVAPLLAAAVGYKFVIQNNPNPNDLYLIGLALVGAIPAALNILKSMSQSGDDAVLLPLIDSANHLQEADSSIEFDPLSDSFTLIVGPKCIIKQDGTLPPQLFISYGAKKDSELLLNYGFLPGVSSGDRKSLAEAFVSRN